MKEDRIDDDAHINYTSEQAASPVFARIHFSMHTSSKRRVSITPSKLLLLLLLLLLSRLLMLKCKRSNAI